MKLLAGFAIPLCLVLFTPAVVRAEPTKMFSATPAAPVGDRTVTLPVTIFGETIESPEPRFRVSARTGLTDLLPEIAAFLQDQIRNKDRGCRERWSAWNGAARIQDGALQATVTARVEKWACETLLGREIKTRLARETGTIHAALVPEVVDGRLQVTLHGFRVDDLSRLSREFGVETFLRGRLETELQKVNGDAAITDLPAPLKEIGYAYDAIVLRTEDATPVAEVAIIGPNDPVALISAIAKLAR